MLRIKKFIIAVIKFTEGGPHRDKNVKNRPIKLKIKKRSVETLVACPIKYKPRLNKSGSLDALLICLYCSRVIKFLDLYI